MSTLPTIAIIGRPNVGKSTLFNRLVGESRSVVNDESGTTRDRIDAIVTWRDKALRFIDTAGIEGERVASLEEDVRQQIAFAQAEADLILCVVDARDQIMQQDRLVAKTLRGSRIPVLLVINKADTQELRTNSPFTFQTLGLGTGLVVSATSGAGTGDLLDRILEHVHAPSPATAQQRGIRFALFGRPNVGKSTLLNALLGEERAIVSDVPGTTRDRIDAHLRHNEHGSFTIIDTAGIKRKKSIAKETLEDWVTQQSIKTLKTCDVALLLLDASEFITAQDRKLATLAYSYGKGLIVIVNKWDLVRSKAKKHQEDMEVVTKDVERELGQLLPLLRTTPAVLIAAKDGRGIEKILPMVNRVYSNRIRRLSKDELEHARQTVFKRVPIPNNDHGKKMRLGTLQQSPDVPPHFTISSGRTKDKIPRAYLQRLEKVLRDLHDFQGVPIRVDQRVIPDTVSS